MLEKIQKPNDIKKIPADQLPALAEEIRKFIIESLSKTGGHLASNLGVVELTIAMHRGKTGLKRCAGKAASADSRSGARVTAMYSTPATARPRFPQASAMCVHGN